MPKQGTIEIYHNYIMVDGRKKKEWRWLVLSPKGNEIACCVEGYKTLTKCHKSYLKFEEIMKLGCKVVIKQ